MLFRKTNTPENLAKAIRKNPGDRTLWEKLSISGAEAAPYLVELMKDQRLTETGAYYLKIIGKPAIPAMLRFLDQIYDLIVAYRDSNNSHIAGRIDQVKHIQYAIYNVLIDYGTDGLPFLRGHSHNEIVQNIIVEIQSKEERENPPISYIEDIKATEVEIGTQIWMIRNLNTDSFRNGDPIGEARTGSEWDKCYLDKIPAWCYYQNDPANRLLYGRLYNWHAVHDPRGLAPEGWHVPSDEEWTILTEYLGGKEEAGGKLKEQGTRHWKSPNTDATNETGFFALPAGLRQRGGAFSFIGVYGFWWTSTEHPGSFGWFRDMYFKEAQISRGWNHDLAGYSVRCIKD